MLEFSGETHPGTKLTGNEDAIGWLVTRQVWLVADGLGGHASGDVASRIVKETILRGITPETHSLKPLILSAHQALLDAAAGDSRLQSMGSTVVVVRVSADRCTVAWCGDSRAYLMRDHDLQRISRDHSLLERMIASGEVTREEAHQHPQQNVLLQALGGRQPAPDEVEVPLQEQDWLLLCSDGLHDSLTDAEIGKILDSSAAPGEATRRLIEAALNHEADDNVSVIAIRVSAQPDPVQDETRGITVITAAAPLPAEAAGDKPKAAGRGWWVIALLILVLLAIWWWS